jgi:hypothetical protein
VHGIATTSTYTAVVLWATYPFKNVLHSFLVIITQVFNLEVTKQLTECYTTESKALLLLLEVHHRCYKGIVQNALAIQNAVSTSEVYRKASSKLSVLQDHRILSWRINDPF